MKAKLLYKVQTDFKVTRTSRTGGVRCGWYVTRALWPLAVNLHRTRAGSNWSGSDPRWWGSTARWSGGADRAGSRLMDRGIPNPELGQPCRLAAAAHVDPTPDRPGGVKTFGQQA